LLREIAFFDGNVGERDRWLDLRDQAVCALVWPLGCFTTDAPISGKVHHLRRRWPPAGLSP
jgi:hypothetical protein